MAACFTQQGRIVNADASPTRLELAAAFESARAKREERKDAALRLAREYLEALPEAYDVGPVIDKIDEALK